MRWNCSVERIHFEVDVLEAVPALGTVTEQDVEKAALEIAISQGELPGNGTQNQKNRIEVISQAAAIPVAMTQARQQTRHAL
jgi:hypothetical protein